jgi:hypothetical protein
VDAIRKRVEAECATINAVAIFVDSIQASKDSRPPRIQGFVPDIYVVDVPTTFTIIGEAKTGSDLQSERSRKQIAAFLEFVAYRANGMFILAVPLPFGATARAMVDAMLNVLAQQPKSVIVLSESVVY